LNPSGKKDEISKIVKALGLVTKIKIASYYFLYFGNYTRNLNALTEI
jgi:hypothetical protein